MLYNSSLVRWFQRKRYQYEVTMPLYMLTPTERFIFNSFLFLILSLIIIAAALYLPEHVNTIARRASFYWAGEDAQAHVKQALQSPAVKATGASLAEKVATASGSVVGKVAEATQRVVDEL